MAVRGPSNGGAVAGVAVGPKCARLLHTVTLSDYCTAMTTKFGMWWGMIVVGGRRRVVLLINSPERTAAALWRTAVVATIYSGSRAFRNPVLSVLVRHGIRSRLKEGRCT